jgi:hypothetical protein
MPHSRFHTLVETLKATRLRSSGVSAYRALGIRQFLRLWLYIALNFPTLCLHGHGEAMRRVALGVGRKGPLRITYRGYSFLWDCGFNDRFVPDPPSFHTVQEMLIRDSYFARHPDNVFANAGTVVDLGANRGLFSVCMATHARLVVGVECLKEFAPLYEHHMKLNGFKNYVLEQAFIGAVPVNDMGSVPAMSMNALLDKHGLQSVDFMKIDIEGSEFPLFREPGWLQRVNDLTMEVHFDHGTLRELCALLEQSGFTYRIASWDLSPISDCSYHVPGGCCLLFANRNRS